MQRGKVHRHVALVAAEGDASVEVPARSSAAGGFSLLRLSVPARFAIVAIAVALLWAAVLWALR